jgi:histidine triad (HIT) family protein
MNQADCLFCRIVEGKIPAKIVHDDALCMAFDDVNPKSPVHVLVVPRNHVATTNDLLPEDEPLAGHLVTVAAGIAKARGVDGSGYRLVLNCNGGAGQSVFHVHLHLMGGRSFAWPPG